MSLVTEFSFKFYYYCRDYYDDGEAVIKDC